MEVTADGSTAYVVLQAAEHPPELWYIDGASDGTRRLLALNPDLDAVALGTSRLIEYRSAEGELRHGALLLPHNYSEGRRVPLIVQVYGGFEGSRVLHRFAFDGAHADNAQLLASRGYAVLWPDMPMADRDPARQLPGLVFPALDRVIELGIADGNRVGILGHSYCGYCVLSLLTQTDRFRVAVAIAGIVNLSSFYGVLSREGESNWLGALESGQGRMGGSLWERRAEYVENSPLFYLDQVTTPLLLASGDAHPGEPAQSEEAFSALRRLGKRAELRVYPDEDHAPGYWSEPSLRDLCGRVLDWFDEFLGVPQ